MSATSAAAFIRIQPSSEQTRRTILKFAEKRGPCGFTCDELASEWCATHNHVAPRVVELVRAGELIPTGRRRPTRTGCSAQIYIAAKFAAPAPAPATQPELALTGEENWRDPA